MNTSFFQVLTVSVPGKRHQPFTRALNGTWSYQRLRSHLVPEHGARERILMGTNVNTPFFQVTTSEFGHCARARGQGLDLVLGH